MGALCVILGAWSWDTKKVREFGSLRRAGFEEAHLVARLLGWDWQSMREEEMDRVR